MWTHSFFTIGTLECDKTDDCLAVLIKLALLAYNIVKLVKSMNNAMFIFVLFSSKYLAFMHG